MRRASFVWTIAGSVTAFFCFAVYSTVQSQAPAQAPGDAALTGGVTFVNRIYRP